MAKKKKSAPSSPVIEAVPSPKNGGSPRKKDVEMSNGDANAAAGGHLALKSLLSLRSHGDVIYGRVEQTETG